jgi:ribosomal protein S18 acetylase RimI-like enzyme
MMAPMMVTSDQQLDCRPAQLGDLEAIIALLADDMLGQSRNPLYADARSDYDAAFAEMLANPNNFVVIARLQGRMVGCYQLTLIRGLSHRGGLRAQIESVRIASDLRGRGIGSDLMRDAIERARARGAGLLQLTTDARRPQTRAFYERLGFVTSHHGMKLAL